MYHYVFLAAVALLAVVGYGVKNRRRRSAKLPPSPPSVPFLGHLHLLGPLLHRSLHELHLRYGTDGGLLLLQLGRRRTLVVSTAAAAADLYRNHDLAFASRPLVAAAHKLSYGSKNITFAPFGEQWRRAKKTAVVHALSPRRVEAFAPVRAAEAAALVAATRRAADAAADGGAVELRDLLYSYTNAVVTRAATGAAGTTAEKLKQLLGNATSLVAGVQADDLLPGMAAKAVRWATGLEKQYDASMEEWDKFLSPIMAEHAEKKKKKREDIGAGEEDFIDVLLRLKEEDTELTDTHVKSRVVAVVKEVLRLHPPAPILVPHESTAAAAVQGYEIPARTSLFVNAWAIGRDPAAWGSPEEFRPERFLAGGPAVDFRGNDYQLVPFGAGRRICPGISFAVPVLEMALVALLHHFDWELPAGMRAGELDMSEAPGLTTPLRVPLRLVPKRKAPLA
uniref:Cytochrome P450 n=1 Tax=Oryza barthii TaxID=65489 RepID=A0A0D3H9A0_9ORYZ